MIGKFSFGNFLLTKHITHCHFMFYIAFLTFSYISLGLGVWIAMRHKEVLRRGQEHESDAGNQSNEFMLPYQMSQEETLNIAAESAEVDYDAPPAIVNEQMPVDSVTPPVTESQSNGEMIEQLVGMAEDSESNDMAAIVQQLQEIHHLVSEADIRCYVSEDAECFITPDKEQYATTAICRPKVGSKKIGNREPSMVS